MRAFALGGIVRAERSLGAQGDDGYRFEVNGHTTWIDRIEFERLAKPDTEPMRFGQALDFALAGRRIRRRGWGHGEDAEGSLEIHDGHLRQIDSSLFHVQIQSEDLLADDWVVVP